MVLLDFELELATPVDECGFGDVEFGSNPRTAPELSAEVNEPGNRFLVFHRNSGWLLVDS